MGTYDTRGGAALCDKAVDYASPCEVCGLEAGWCDCIECSHCGAAGDPQCHIKNIVATRTFLDGHREKLNICWADISRCGKKCIYGNNTQFNVAELRTGEIVQVRGKDNDKVIAVAFRDRLKGIWADPGRGAYASDYAIAWEAQ